MFLVMTTLKSLERCFLICYCCPLLPDFLVLLMWTGGYDGGQLEITQAGQPFYEFLTSVINQGKKCEFGELYDSLLRDKIVVEVCSDTVREKLLAEKDLAFDKTVKICRASEIIKLLVSAMRSDTLPSVHAMHISHKSKCPKCGYNHPQRTCPAVGKECKKCGKVGHFAQLCLSKQVLTVNSGQQCQTPGPNSSETFFVSSIDIHHELDWIEKLILPNGNSVSFKLDTVAESLREL
ncbi:hypothetical protein PR048_004677 [Dryococelus australis]|uniref:CCHC-type domain-containing protein n=1 Tax=Dryococelus australis TaxID=614101 RepID=A0ABQ9I633_9NEOP|nr:hypothetical protein PR048_004677 [Dryococelus australis]